MKKLLLLLSAFTLLFISCEEEENTNDENNSLEGTWLLTSRTVDGVSQELESCASDDKVSFNNGVFKSEYYYEVETYNEENQSWSYTCSDETEINLGTYTTNGNTLTITFPETTSDEGGADTSTVTYNITGNILTVTFENEEDDTEYYLETGNYRIIDVTVVETYTKQ